VADRTPVVVWEKSRDAYSASIEGPSGAVRFFLIVEDLGGRYHWSIWRPGESILEARHGSARSAQEALRHAEQAII